MTSELLHAGPIAYFSMDVAVDSAIPTYSGGLGVLAGDMLRSAADLGFRWWRFRCSTVKAISISVSTLGQSDRKSVEVVAGDFSRNGWRRRFR